MSARGEYRVALASRLIVRQSPSGIASCAIAAVLAAISKVAASPRLRATRMAYPPDKWTGRPPAMGGRPRSLIMSYGPTPPLTMARRASDGRCLSHFVSARTRRRGGSGGTPSRDLRQLGPSQPESPLGGLADARGDASGLREVKAAMHAGA